jgi:hypothetical protein
MLGSFPPELLVVFTATSLLRSREPTLSCNQLSTFDHPNPGDRELLEMQKKKEAWLNQFQ